MDVAQLVVFLVWDQEVAGSSPAYPTKKYLNIIQLNLLVWHNICIFVYEITGVWRSGSAADCIQSNSLKRIVFHVSQLVEGLQNNNTYA